MKFKDPMKQEPYPLNALRVARVAQLKAFYDAFEATETSAFDVPSMDIELFKKEYYANNPG